MLNEVNVVAKALFTQLPGTFILIAEKKNIPPRMSKFFNNSFYLPNFIIIRLTFFYLFYFSTINKNLSAEFLLYVKFAKNLGVNIFATIFFL